MKNTELRIDQTVIKLEKLNKKLSRIKKALSGGKNPYYYEERDLRITTKEIIDTESTLKKFLAKKEKEEQELSERCEVIETFLENWEQKALTYYKDEYVALNEFVKTRGTFNNYIEYEQALNNKFSRLIIDCRQYGNEWPNRLEKEIEREKDAKRTTLMARIKNITGKIIDASGLHIGMNGEINGFVKGDKSKATVETIGAGGYNIQCFHFRVLVREIA